QRPNPYARPQQPQQNPYAQRQPFEKPQEPAARPNPYARPQQQAPDTKRGSDSTRPTQTGRRSDRYRNDGDDNA
ncbi:MAG: hypothetical protein IH607_05040, partial [Firmicutes bacterium]|nr:hypothetical protein [Bacillota bacterium]